MKQRAKRLGRLTVLGMGLVLGTAWAADTLSAADVNVLLSGKTGQGTLQSGRYAGQSIEVVFGADGRTRVSGAVADEGRWRVSDSGYCVKWNTLRNGQEACFTVGKHADGWMVYNADGSANGLFTQLR